MKRVFVSVIVCIVAFSCLAAAPVSAFAGPTPKAAKAAYVKALKAQDDAKTDCVAAKKAYAKASKAFNKGSYGFYQWVADTKSGWMAEDAKEALTVLRDSGFKSYTKLGDSGDATGLENMKKAVKLLDVLEEKRQNDEYHPNLQPVTVRSVYMAAAQIHANASAETYQHMPNDPGTNLGVGNENLAWGYSDPFAGWYDAEKVSFEKKRAYTLKKYGVDIAKSHSAEYYNWLENVDYDAYLEETQGMGETGHYGTVCLNGFSIHSYDGITYQPAEHVFFGLAHDGYCSCLRADVDSYQAGYTVNQYQALFNRYYDSVNPKAEETAYNAAKKASDKAKKATKKKLAALKKAMTPKNVTAEVKAKGKAKRVTVGWKKVSVADSYQISLTPKKSKTKIAKKVGSSKVKAALTAESSKKIQYVRVRAVTTHAGKTIYGDWSKPKTVRFAN